MLQYRQPVFTPLVQRVERHDVLIHQNDAANTTDRNMPATKKTVTEKSMIKNMNSGQHREEATSSKYTIKVVFRLVNALRKYGENNSQRT